MAPPRYHSQNSASVAANILDSISAKEDQYMQSIQQNHMYCKQLASNILRFQKDLSNMAKDCMTQEEIDSFINEQKEIVRGLAVKNVHRQRFVARFVKAVQQVRQQTMHLEDPEFGFQKAIDEAMEKIEATSADTQIEIFQEKLYLDVMEKMGEHHKEVDEDLEIVETGTNTQGTHLKCPVSGQMMTDAVRNKACGHSYSRVGILAHIKNSRKCPMPGCANKNVQETQLEDDLDTQHAVRREIRRKDHMAERQATLQVDDTDEE